MTEMQEVTASRGNSVVDESYSPGLRVGGDGSAQESFLRCSQVSSQAKAYRLIRPWGLTHLESTVDTVEKFLLAR